MNIDSNPDNADWLQIMRAKRIAEQIPNGKQIWEAALREANGSKSGALMAFYNLLSEAGVDYEAYLKGLHPPNNPRIKGDGFMSISDHFLKLGAKAQEGSKPRCHLLTHGGKREVAQRLAQLITGVGTVNCTDRWMPVGFDEITEAELDKAENLLGKEHRDELRNWWLKAGGPKTRTPNWDIVSTCTVNGKKGFLLIEAKAHVNELKNEVKGKQLESNASPNSKLNHKNIGICIDVASKELSYATKQCWNLSRDSHYQMANRFAWAWKLTQLGYPVILVYLGFLQANEMKIPFNEERSWSEEVFNHSKPLFPQQIWGLELSVNGQSFIPLIRTSKQKLELS
ncbi:hypothetical protein GMSM_29670 [Geomonas sp. Red276]